MSEFQKRIATLSPKRLALLAIEQQSKLDALQQAKREPLAVIGIGCRFPKSANNPDAFWQLLCGGVDGITEVPPDRWNIDEYYDPDLDAPGKMSTRWGGFMDDVTRFDPQFFGIAPREALSMDPQQRLLLELSWEALEHAGQAPDQLKGSISGVFLGICGTDYFQLLLSRGAEKIDTYFATGVAHSVAAGRLAYVLGLKGPAVSVDTACSSSLVAVHMACQSLRLGECRLALVGGVNHILQPEATVSLSKGQMMAPDGRCKAFDASGDGFVRGEGGGVVVLKRLSDAISDGDRVLAVIRGSATNQDGRSNGLTAPNGPSQETVIREALSNAGVEPSQVSYVEAHGTGTSLGDPIEVQALGAVLGQGRSKENRLTIGSVKTNVGHLEAAAGIAGLIKVVLALQHRQIPPHLHFRDPNPHIPWAELALQVPTELTPWDVSDGPRIAGVSSFGFSGTNAHVVLEEAPEPALAESEVERRLHVLCLSAKSQGALKELARSYEQHFQAHPKQSLADVCFTANAGRAHFNHRIAVVGDTADAMAEGLNLYSQGSSSPQMMVGETSAIEPKIVFLFAGQGSQYIGMGRELYETQPTFRATLVRCDELLRPYLERPLLSVLYPSSDEDSPLDETAYTQPALFALEYALAELWRSWGIEPAVVTGHSVGEYVAACVAGVFTLEDGLKLIAERARLMHALPQGGAMAAVFTDDARVQSAIAEHRQEVSIAAYNGPDNTVISGESGAVDKILKTLQADGITVQPLTVSHAFHSPLLRPMLDEFEQVASQVTYARPNIDLVSNMTGGLVNGDDVTQPNYWRRHVSEPVKFAASIETLRGEGCETFLEIGPHTTLLGMASACLPEDYGAYLPSLRKGRDAWSQILESCAKLYVGGAHLDWSAFDRDYSRRRISLPTYPFQRERYWPEFGDRVQTGSRPSMQTSTLLGRRTESAHNEIIFDSEVGVESPPFLSDHRIHGMVLMPAAVYIEMALAAAADIFASDASALLDLTIHEALVIPDTGARSVQMIMTPRNKGEASFEIFSRPTDQAGTAWTLHASGRLASEQSDFDQTISESLKELRQRFDNEVPATSYYRQLQDRGIDFGPAFQGIERLWQGHGEALALLQLPESLEEDAGRYRFHPAMLDACLQTLGASLAGLGDSTDDTFLMVGVERFRASPGPSYWAHASIETGADPDADSLTGNIRLLNNAGSVVGSVEGVRLTRVRPGALSHAGRDQINDWLYEVRWQPKSHASADVTGVAADYLPDPATVADRMRLLFPQLSAKYGLDRYRDLVMRLEDLSVAYVQNALQKLGWRFDRDQPVSVDLLAEQLGITGYYKSLLQRLLAMLTDVGTLKEVSGQLKVGRVPKGQDVSRSSAELLDAYSEFEGELSLLGRCGEQLAEVLRGDCDPLQLLFPGGSMAAVEKLTQNSPVARVYNSLIQEAMATAVEHLPVGRKLRILELGAGTGGTTAGVLPLLPMDRTEYIFTDISRLFLSTAEQKFEHYPFVRYRYLDIEIPPEDQGFSAQSVDVVLAANVLHATSDLRRTLANVRQLLAPGGLLVLAEGTAAQRWIDLTFGLTEGWWKFSDTELRPSHPLLSRRRWLELIRDVGFAEVAAIPEGSAGTGHVSDQAVIVARAPGPVQEVANRQPPATTIDEAPAGQWLIFTDNAGVGEQLTELITTHGGAGIIVSPAKKYKALKDGHICIDPASPGDFHRLFEEALGAENPPLRGIVHLSSLDTTVSEQMTPSELDRATATSCRSVLFLVQALIKAQPGESPRLWLATAGAQAAGATTSPINVTQAPLWGLGRTIALEHPEIWGGLIDLDPDRMQDAAASLFAELRGSDREDQVAYRDSQRLVGRLARLEPLDVGTAIALHEDGSYLITGGTGGMGIEVARWMVAKGARRLVVVARHKASELADAALEELRQLGVDVVVVRADVANKADVTKILEGIAKSGKPLRGIVHAAGIFDDRVLLRHDWDRFERVLEPKVRGAWILHQLTRELTLDFFIFFSSAASVLAAVGLGNYSAANAFLDAMAHYRRGKGLPAVSINWGPWARVGMAEAVGEKRETQWTQGGFSTMTAQQGLDVLEVLTVQAPTQVAVLRTEWPKYLERFGSAGTPPLLDNLAQEKAAPIAAASESARVSGFAEQLETVPATERKHVLVDQVKEIVIEVLGFRRTASFDIEQGLFDMGMDSLTAVEMKNRLQVAAGRSLPSTLAFDHPSVQALADYLADEVIDLEFAPSIGKPSAADQPLDDDITPTEQLSEDCLAEMLATKLRKINN